MKLSECATAVRGELHGDDKTFFTVSTDTRTVNAGQLYIALKGPNFDGHHYIEQAEKLKAIAAVISRPIESALPIIRVSDTLVALGDLGAYHRRKFILPVVALTGSCGKTTTKSMIANILQLCGNTLATPGTMNNKVGVPKTLLELTSEHLFACIEIGTNEPGEIDYLTRLVQPTVALITNIGPAHLELFKTLEGVAQEKSTIYRGLDAKGIAVMNADEPFVKKWRKEFRDKQIITFGLKQKADVTAQSITLNKGCAAFTLLTPSFKEEIQLPLIGEHQVQNALAAAACCYALGINSEVIKQGLESLQPVDKRMVNYVGLNGARIIDDTYNANPLSTKMAIKVLMEHQGDKIFVLGDMKELGDNEVAMHAEIGKIAKELGVSRFYAYGKLSRVAAEQFGDNAFYYDNQTDLIRALKPTFN